jgi:aminopeptidase-like protein
MSRSTPSWTELDRVIADVSVDSQGRSMMDLAGRLFPICRSITGDGVRETLSVLSEVIDLELHSVQSGYEAFDWTVPPEWNIRDAYVKDPAGRRVIDFRESNLHVINYSTPVSTTMTRAELDPHLHTKPDQPDAIPYLTSYYEERWGFCLQHDRLDSLGDGPFEVVIDSSLEPGELNYADAVLPGRSDREILLSTYFCHPSMANNELSGPIVLAYLYELLKPLKLRNTYRFVYGPETIGAIVYLSKHGDHLKQSVAAGYVATCTGDDGEFYYKRSRRGNSLADRAAEHALVHAAGDHGVTVEDFFPWGSDERQYCSPGFDMPVGSITRSRYGRYPEYHTSLDDLSFISGEGMVGALRMYLRTIQALEMAGPLHSNVPYGEPQLGKRDLYPTLGAQSGSDGSIERMMYLLAYADGEHDAIQVAEKSGFCVWELGPELTQLVDAELLTMGELP